MAKTSDVSFGMKDTVVHHDINSPQSNESIQCILWSASIRQHCDVDPVKFDENEP